MTSRPVVARLEASSDPPMEPAEFPTSKRPAELFTRRRSARAAQTFNRYEVDERVMRALERGWIPKSIPVHPCGIIYSDTGVPHQELKPVVRPALYQMLLQTLGIANLPAGKTELTVLDKPDGSRCNRGWKSNLSAISAAGLEPLSKG